MLSTQGQKKKNISTTRNWTIPKFEIINNYLLLYCIFNLAHGPVSTQYDMKIGLSCRNADELEN